MRTRRRTADDLGEAFRTLSPWLERRLVGRDVGRADVDDIVQESFLRFGRYEGAEKARHPRALLLRIASNLVVDLSRRRSARGGGREAGLESLESLPDASPDPAFLLDLKRTILDLPPGIRDAFLLARFTPLTNAQIAERLGVSTKTVEWRISRAVSICLARLGR